MERDPEKIIIIGLIENLWNGMGESSASVWREIGQKFTDEFERLGMDMSTPEASLESVKKYFTETYDFAEDVKYEIM